MEKAYDRGNDPLMKSHHANLDQSYQQGPSQNRKFNDIFCAVLFVICFLASAGLWIFISTQNDVITPPAPQNQNVVTQQIDDDVHLNDKQITAVTLASVAVFFSSLIISFALVYLTPMFAEGILWFMILLQGGVLIGNAVFFFMEVKGQEGQVIGGILIGFACLYFLTVYCLRENIRRCIILIKGASQFLVDHKASLLLPLIGFIIYLGFLTYFAFLQIDVFNKYNELKISKDVFDGAIYSTAFMFIWTTTLVQFSIILGLCIFICQWYFSYQQQGQRIQLESPLKKSIWWPIRYHFGSVCFGSLIITVVTIIRSIAQGKAQNSRNLGAQFLYCLTKCIEDICKHLSKMALIMMAMTGDPFCHSARQGLDQVLNHFGDYLVLQPLSEYYVNFGIFLVSVLSSLIGLLILSTTDMNNYEWLFVALFFIGSIIISSMFLNIVTMAANCCLFYMTVDKLLNDNAIQHGPPILLEIDQISVKEK